MDAFEEIVAGLLFQEGYWVAQGFKVNLTQEDKIRINRRSCPRWEIDLLAYKASTNELLAIECKSYLDSRGVRVADFIAPKAGKSRYKLFVEEVLRKTVLARLGVQVHELGLTPTIIEPRLVFVAGNIHVKDHEALSEHFRINGWDLFDAAWLFERLKRTSTGSYQDSVVDVVSKLIFRNPTLGY